MDKVKVRNNLFLVILLIASIFSLLTLNKEIHLKHIREKEKNKNGKVIKVDDHYELVYYVDNSVMSTNSFPNSTKKTYICKSKECGIVKTGGLFSVLYDDDYYIFDGFKGKKLYKSNYMRDINFSMMYNRNHELKNNYFVVFRDSNNISYLYNFKKNKITISGEFKEIYTDYIEEYQPNTYYVIAINKDKSRSLINYNNGKKVLDYQNMYCAKDGYCVVDNKFVYDFTSEAYIVRPNVYEHIYMAIKNGIVVLKNNNILVIDDNGNTIETLFNLNDYKDYNIKSYFSSSDDGIIYIVFDLIKGDNQYRISYNLKTLEIMKQVIK